MQTKPAHKEKAMTCLHRSKKTAVSCMHRQAQPASVEGASSSTHQKVEKVPFLTRLRITTSDAVRADPFSLTYVGIVQILTMCVMSLFFPAVIGPVSYIPGAVLVVVGSAPGITRICRLWPATAYRHSEIVR
jgi:hypothetical protein